jgi:hypothetical protein
MNILKVFALKKLNFKSARSLLSTFFVRKARALLCCEWRLEFGGVGIYGCEDCRIFTDFSLIELQ